MELPFTLDCSRCRKAASTEGTPTVCADCGSPLFARYDLKEIGRTLTRRDLASRAWTMWRYRELLPLAAGEEPITLGEGGTPLLPIASLARRTGVAVVHVKEEGLNPTASFKARGMAVAVTRAVTGGVRGFVVPSAGNAAAALSAYGARAGVPVRAYMPRDTPPIIVAECRSFGADVCLVDGVIIDCAREARRFAAEAGYFDVSTLREPYRVEGKKTMGFEILEQLDWRVPDAIIYPTGGGTGIIGMWKAFAELEEVGWLEPGRRPRMYVVQSSGCAPIVRAYEAGAEAAERWERPETVASGLRVPSALGDFLILRAVRESGGAAVAVSDSELLRGQAEMLRSGIGACPEGGATLAALHRLRERGEIAESDQVVLFNTGAWLKYLD